MFVVFCQILVSALGLCDWSYEGTTADFVSLPPGSVVPELPGHELFDLVARPHIPQISATFKGTIINCLDSMGYIDVYGRHASYKSPPPNLLQPIVKNHSPRQPPEQPQNASLLIALSMGDIDAYE